MKKTAKYLVSFLAVCLIAAFCGFSLYAEESESISASGRFGELGWKFSKDSGVLTVFGEGEMAAPLAYDYWYTYAPFVASIVIDEGAENIAGGIFESSTMLSSVTIPDSVTLIDENAFPESEILLIKCNYGSYAAEYANVSSLHLEYLDIIDCGNCGEAVNWVLYKDGVLKISGSGKMPDFLNASDIPWYSYSDDIKKGIIDDGVENVGQAAFYKCNALESVSLGKDIETIGVSAFSYCSSLTDIELPENLKKIESYAFSLCKKMNGLKLPQALKSIGDLAFMNCEAISEIELPSSVTSIGNYAFQSCFSIKEIFYPATVITSGTQIFDFCSGLESVCFEEGIIEIPYGMFSNCDNLKNVVFPKSLKYTGEAVFVGCDLLNNIELPEGIEKIGARAFENTGIGDFSIPSSLLYIGDRAFARTVNLKSLYIPETVSEIHSQAFNSSHVVLCCDKGSYADKYVQTNNISYIYNIPSIKYADLQISVETIYAVKDISFAKGTYETYEDAKNNLVYRVTSEKLKDKTSFAYSVSDSGTYTVFIRYHNGKSVYEHISVLIIKPVFKENGLQLTVDNLINAKYIRVAYGDYDTVGQISRAEAERTFTSKDVLRGKTQYTIQFREEGLATVAVCYNTGYIEYYKYNVTKKVPRMIIQENSVTFEGLDDLLVLRYTYGEYSSSKEIKYAPASKAIRGKDITSDKLTLKLMPGTYTFCVQYKDESYNYYTLTI